MTGDFRALVCITSCRRLALIRRYLPHYAAFCRSDPRFSLVVSLDGTEKGYLEFCEEWDVPLIYSEKREGVGLSKNRALKRFPDFDYYVFIEDDVELVDGSVFPIHIELAAESGIHHFSLFDHAVRKPTGESVVAGTRVAHGMFGGGGFSFFTRMGLERVGGWHPMFARYRRWGHTEHSYRFPRAGLAPSPFNVAEELSDAFIWHSPPAVTRVEQVAVTEDQIPFAEQELIEQGLDFVPVETLCPYHLQGSPDSRHIRLASMLTSGDRYPLVDPPERRQCRSDFLLWQSRSRSPFPRSAATFLRAFAAWPSNPAIRHAVKNRLKTRGQSPAA